ncbi:hypothetical protein GGR55DRAFT_680285 [Xylaria sp. FL0064]|nr:hypothetical protein GGR55DRAFT_680285 [Xylaria sp. FL0064]
MNTLQSGPKDRQTISTGDSIPEVDIEITPTPQRSRERMRGKITPAPESMRIRESASRGESAPEAERRRSDRSIVARGSTPSTQRMRATRLNSDTRAPFTPARKSSDPSAPTSTRKISATFSTDCPRSGHATVACSAVTASMTTKHTGPPSNHAVSNESSDLSSSQSYRNMETFATTNNALKASHTCSNLPMPSAQYKAPSSGLTAYANVKALKAGHNTENIPPSVSMADIAAKKQSTYRSPTPKLAPKQSPSKTKMRSRLSISKSRTFSVFSNFTASLSRTSLGQFTGSESRRTSISSKSTARKDPAPYTNSQSSQSASSTTSSQAILYQTPEPPADPRQIYTAQSSAYWAGRFMALQDKFQSEALLPENLSTLVHAHAERSLLAVTQPSLASSATTGCITPAAAANKLPPLRPPTGRPTAGSTSPRKRQQQQTSVSRARPLPPKFSRSATTTTTSTTAITTMAPPPKTSAAAALLVDEDTRVRRVFAHLDALCATSEARLSLQQWQQCYARRAGKEHLFVGAMPPRKKTRELTWVGRLLVGSGSSGGGHSKRGSFGL